LVTTQDTREPKFHARYILTDIVGVRVDTGLDYQINGDNQTTDVGLLDRAIYEQRWRELQKDTTVFDHVITVKVDGTHE